MTDSLLCGWRVRSSLSLPELLPWTGDDRPPDLTIAEGSVPDRLEDLVFSGVLLQIGRDGSSRFALPNVAAYHVDAVGRTVTIAPAPGVHDPAVRAFLFGSVLGILCQRRGLLPLHACCVRFESPEGPYAVAFSAASGTGKSTLAAGFRRKGHEILADDLTVLDLVEGSVMVRPSFPRVKLWRDVLVSQGWPIDELERVRSDLEKYCLPLAEGFCRESLPLRAICHVARVRDERHLQQRSLRGMAAVTQLGQAVYHDRTMMRFAGGAKRLFEAVTRFAAAVPQHHRIAFLEGLDRLDETIGSLNMLSRAGQ